MMKHTKGNWRVAESNDECFAFISSDTWAGLASVVVRINKEDSDESVVSLEGQANARLIAAAPELLEACDEAQFMLQRILNGEEVKDLIEDGSIKCMIEQCNQAIAKAEGV